MFVMEFIVAVVISLLLSAIFFFGFRRGGPWPNFFLFFLIIFLAAWAGGLWIDPIGPAIGGVFWVPFLLVGLIFALLLAAATPPPPKETTVELKTKEQLKKEERIKIAF